MTKTHYAALSSKKVATFHGEYRQLLSFTAADIYYIFQLILHRSVVLSQPYSILSQIEDPIANILKKND